MQLSSPKTKEKIKINDLLVLINILPNIFWYFATGYIFIKIYEYVSHNDNKYELKNILLSSMVISFVIKTIFDFCIQPFTATGVAYSILILLATVVSSYVIATFSKSQTFDTLQTKLKINRTQNSNIWYDIFKKDAWVRIFLKDGITTYLGKIEMLEENSKEPIMILSHYQLVSITGKVIVDYSKTHKEKIILNIKDFERIELTED